MIPSTHYGDSLHPSIYDLPHTLFQTDNSPSSTLSEQEETESLFQALLDAIPRPGQPASTPIIKFEDEESSGTTVLRTAEHDKYLASTLFALPSGFAALDASRPWLIYWTFHTMDILGISADQEIRKRSAGSPRDKIEADLL